MYGHKWAPSKARAREFAQQMDEVAYYCHKNNISHSGTMDSYYFNVGDVEYRISNHAVERSSTYHPEGREPGVVYIHASKTRLPEIHRALLAGKKLDGHGKEVES